MRNLLYTAAALLLLALGSCIEQYVPDVAPSSSSFLVVDGFINGNGRTRVRLSRTLNVAATTAPPPVRGATVYILDNLGQRYNLRETSVFGSYISDSLLLTPGRQYQLRMVIGTGSTAATYFSKLTPLLITPDFDQAALVRQDDQVQLRVSTHDAAGQTHFYRWRTTETWEFNPPYKSKLEVIGGKVRNRVTPIYTCYRTEQPSRIVHTSTAGLSQDVVRQQLVLACSDRAERVRIRYSVLVSQAAESAEEFAYTEVLRKNTEAVGTVNDPLPSQLTGNVTRVGNEAEPVLGFVGAHTVVQRRLFATPASLALPAGWRFDSPYDACQLGIEVVPNLEDKYPIYRPNTRIFLSGDNVPVDYYITAEPDAVRGDTAGYVGSTRYCVDCRERGSIVKPSFW